MKPSRRERRAQVRLERKKTPSFAVSPKASFAVRWRTRIFVGLLIFSLCAIGATALIHRHHSQQTEPTANIAVATASTQALHIGSEQPPSQQPLSVVNRTRTIHDAPLPPHGQFTLETMLERSPDGINGIDIAEMNLLCAKGLPGTEQLNIPALLARLDQWAAVAQKSIAQNQHRFVENPGEYKNSENFFRMVMLVLTLQQEFGVHYDLAKMGPSVSSTNQADISKDLSDTSYFRDPESVFLHGILGDKREGTCSSMPVLYVAVARRLGFPVKLSSAVGHLFARWDGDGERFNIEGTREGVNSYPDEFYMNWPLPISKEDVATGQYIKSFTPAEELACFMQSRAACFKENGRLPESMVAIAQANRFQPGIYNTQIGLAKTVEAVTLPVQGPTSTDPMEFHRRAVAQAEAMQYQNAETERARLLREIQQLKGTGQTPGSPYSPTNTRFPNENSSFPPGTQPPLPPGFNSGLPQSNAPFSPSVPSGFPSPNPQPKNFR